MSSKGKRTVSRSEYHEYIVSDAWKATRKRYWSSKMSKKCYVCGEKSGSLELHHRTYKNLGNERLMDLVPVHRECHELIHKLYNERTNKKDGLWQMTTKARRLLSKSKK